MMVKSRRLGQLLLEAERRIGLLKHAEPLNFESECRRLVQAQRSGEKLVPHYRYRGPAESDQLVQALAALGRHDAGFAIAELEGGGLGSLGGNGGASQEQQLLLLFIARARELGAELEVRRAVGTPWVSRAAAQRYQRGGDSVLRQQEAEALGLATAWLEVPPDDEDEERVISDDAGDPKSLLCQTRLLLEQYQIPFRVQLTESLVAHAATSQDTIWIPTRRQLGVRASRRIALHEVLAHAGPRSRAEAEESRLFLAATAFGAEDEEGRALVIEQRYQLLGVMRRRELAARHLAATWMFEGASFQEIVEQLLARDVQPELAVRISCRVFRGSVPGHGGLGRECLYLPAFLRVGEALSREPSLERWLERGRVGLGAARLFDALGFDATREASPIPADLPALVGF